MLPDRSGDIRHGVVGEGHSVIGRPGRVVGGVVRFILYGLLQAQVFEHVADDSRIIDNCDDAQGIGKKEISRVRLD